MTDLARGRHFDVLDGLRGIAASVVLLDHSIGLLLLPGGSFVPRVNLAVVFFFMLSGFVVASAYEERLKGSMSVGEFMLRRAIRLHPLLVVGAVAGAGYFALADHRFFAGSRWMVATVAGMSGLPSVLTPFSFSRFPLNPPEWSLFFELVAYGAYAIVLTRLSTPWLFAAFTLAFTVHAVIDVRNALDLPLAIFEALAAFSAGVLLWRLHRDRVLPRVRLPSIVLGGTVAGACFCPRFLGPAVDLLTLALVFPCVLIAGANRGRGAATAFERWLGDLSFPVYILHWPILLCAGRLVTPRLGPVAALLIGLTFAVLVPWVVLRWVDEPLRAWLVRALLPGRGTGAASSRASPDAEAVGAGGRSLRLRSSGTGRW